MRSAAARRATTGQLVLGAVILFIVFLLCSALLLTWVLRIPVTTRPSVVTVSMPRTGGLFEGSVATYRGQRVGAVTDLANAPDGGVRATVRLDTGAEVPASSKAKVRSLSAVGEQYLDFQPPSADGPFLADGAEITATASDLPVSLAKASQGFQGVLTQIDSKKVEIVLHELTTALSVDGPDMGELVSRSHDLLVNLDESGPTLERVIRNGGTSLRIVTDNRGRLISWAEDAAVLGNWAVEWNPAFRKNLEQLPADLAQVLVLVDGARHRLPGLLGSLLPMTRLFARHAPHLLALLATAPYGVGRFASTMRDGYMNVTINLNGQETCEYGTARHDPRTGDRHLPPLDGRCGTTPWRGGAHAPAPVAP